VIAETTCVDVTTGGPFTQKLLTAAAPEPTGVFAQSAVLEQPAFMQVFVVASHTLPLKGPSTPLSAAAPDDGLQS
jgi:hypothetical protein